MSVELVVAGNILSANVDTPVTNIPSLNVENPTCVDTPDTFNWLVSVVASTKISLLKVDTPTNVETPDTFNCFVNNVSPVTVAIPENVEIPETFKSRENKEFVVIYQLLM